LAKHAHGRRARRAFVVLNLLPAFLFGLLLSAVIDEAAGLHRSLGYLFSVATGHEPALNTMGHKLVALLTVLIATIAGATRYVTGSFAWEAELHSYREALGVFARAARECDFAAATLPLSQDQRKLLFDLGRIALEENGSWIRAHRVRPLEPMP
jgi:hypothetical protein